MSLNDEIATCRICAGRFAATCTRHSPRPVVLFDGKPRILIAGQAPGMRVQLSGKPFDDRSGDRLRDWLGIEPENFYDRSKIAIVPMALCFPGYDAAGSDLPPPKVCKETWHDRIMAQLGEVPLTIVVGGYAHRYHLDAKSGVMATVQGWRELAPRLYPLPHPSWRNTGWLKKNPWFADELLPDMRAQVKDVLQ